MEEDYKLAKWLNDDMNEAELTEFKNSAEYAIYEKIRNYSAKLETPSFNQEAMLSDVYKEAKKEVKVVPIKSSYWIMKIAASIVLVMGFGYLYLAFSTTSELAENGKKNSFLLPDQSKVVLNAGSEIEFKKWNWDNNRKLNLNGEAYFKVAKGKKFEVETALGKVTVLGTQFNVKARENRFDVTCYEGKVKVNYQNTEVIITKGKRVSFANGSSITIPENNTNAPEWTNGELAFEKENIKAITAELSRQYNVIIELKNIQTDKQFSGSLPADNLNSAVQILKTVFQLNDTKISENKIVLTEIDVKK
jgi:transmembrane sensor